jgi:hypothetical protein
MGTTGVICAVLVGAIAAIVFVWVNIDKIDEGLREHNRFWGKD